MKIEKCKWKYGKQAPLVIMMDDLANKYMTDQKNGDYIGADWGGRCKKKNSWYGFIEKNIFQKYPYVKMTCFLVTGRREDSIKNGKRNITLPIDANEEFKEFLLELIRSERVELAYHGYTHGKIFEEKFIQEWSMYRTLSEALKFIEKGKQLYQKTTGEKFRGGKYCGYAKNDFSDESIIKSGFDYWCRHWDANVLKGRGTGIESLELDFFEQVVDIPSTIDGSLCSLKQIKNLCSRKYVKALYYLFRYHLTLEGIVDSLVSKNQVLSIQSHTSPMREDDKRQSPNVIDDIKNIQYILEYVKRYDIWYATCEEISDYFRVYSSVDVKCHDNEILLNIKGKLLENVKNKELYIKIYELNPNYQWYLQDGKKEISLLQVEGCHMASVPVKEKQKYMVAYR